MLDLDDTRRSLLTECFATERATLKEMKFFILTIGAIALYRACCGDFGRSLMSALMACAAVHVHGLIRKDEDESAVRDIMEN